jgi:thioredoxin-related protein
MLRTLILAMMVAFSGQAIGASIGDDGLHKEDWFSVTFRDIREDIEDATASGKRLALIFEQRGCIYCKMIHEEILTDPEVRAYLEKNYMIVQYNLYGDEEVVDLDGEVLTEKTAARKWGVIFTPTILFMPDKSAEDLSASRAAVAVMPGAFKKGTFMDLFTWVREKGYETDEDFQRFHARRIRERTAAGIKNTD